MMPIIRVHPVKTIIIHPAYAEHSWASLRKGDVRTVLLHGLRWPAELRDNPTRVRLLENSKGLGAPVRCEILDPWPGAPEHYPEERPVPGRPSHFYV